MKKSLKNKKASAKDAKVEKVKELTQGLNGMQLLGEVITWSTKSEEPQKHKDVVAALMNAGLDTAIARELLPRFAFSRATKKLTDAAAIDVLKENDTHIRFQFTKKAMKDDEWVYSKDTELTLNKTTGEVSCPRKDLKESAQRLLDEAIEVRTTSDISKIVQRLIEKNGDLFPIREQGGVYFVPVQFTEFIARIEIFLGKLGGRVTRFPVPAGTQFGDRAVQDSIADAMMAIIENHRQAVAQFTVNTRRDTIEHAAEKIKSTRVKIEAYADYLKDKSQELLDEVEKANGQLTAQVETLAQAKEDMPEGPGGLFGHSVTAVIRTLGKEGWSFGDTKAALKAQGLSIADATIRAQLLAGRNGTRGEPAVLKEKELKQLKKSVKESVATAA
jgi:CHAD domain-containing protein